MSLLLSGVVAAIVSGLMGGLFNVIWANKLKRNSDINTFRYTKLYELNAELNSLEPVDYDLSDMSHLVNQSTARYGIVTGIFNKALPLLEAEHKREPLRLLSESEKLSNRLVEKLYANKKVHTKEVSLKELLLKRQSFEKEVNDAFLLTLSAILKQ